MTTLLAGYLWCQALIFSYVICDAITFAWQEWRAVPVRGEGR